MFFTSFWIILSQCAGHSGGGTFVPLYRLIFSFDVKNAIRISNLTIVTAAFVSFLTNIPRSHPTKKDTKGKSTGVMLDYNLVIIICPMGVVGSVIGAIFAEFCPEPVIIVAMTLCLLLLATYIGYRLYNMCKQEQQARLSIKQS
jgi:uncharacterized membrane protein YfcA